MQAIEVIREQRLASTYLNTLGNPVGTAVIPFLFTNKLYRRQQEDPHEFLFDAINGVLAPHQAPTLHSLLCGRDHSWLVCSSSSCSHIATTGQPWRRRTTGYEDFTNISLPLVQQHDKHTDTVPACYSSVQEALTAFLKPERMSTGFAWTCQVCGSTAPPFKESHITHTPQVLMLQLKRWAARKERGALLNRVKTNRVITFAGHQYSLCSFVCHQGTNAKSGHYTCCVKQPCPRGDWWYYNNSVRRLARDSEMITTDDERTYLLWYERMA